MQNEIKNPLREFSMQFFKSLGCKLEEKGEELKVSGAPSAFEKAVGKPAPYSLVFEQKEANDNNELIVKGSYFLKTMLEYAGSKGQTALVKLEIPFDSKNLVSEKIKFYNAEITRTAHKARFECVSRFSFLTTFQYLNEKEQIKTEVDVAEGNLINFDSLGFEFRDGRKEEVNLPDMQESYKLAKERARFVVSKKTEELSEMLSERLEKELERIKNHFAKQIREVEEAVEKNQKIISEAEKQILKGNESEKELLNARIARAKEQIAKIENSGAKQKIEQEREFFLSDEANKHGLSVDSKLNNTTIIYYPVFIVYTTIRQVSGQKKMREFSFEFNPMSGKIKGVKCESCLGENRELALCSLGHLACAECADKCLDCGEIACKSCFKKKCFMCEKKSCESCMTKCPGCWKYVCKSHAVSDSLNGREMCQKCIKNCESCKRASDKKNFVNCPLCNKEFCERCIRREFIGGRIKTGCLRCLRKRESDLER